MDRDAVKYLNLHNNRIGSFCGMIGFENLLELNVSSNSIQRFDGMVQLPNLVLLDVSCNKLTSLEGFPVFLKLEKLVLGYNSIERLDDRLCVANTPALKYLDIRQNLIKHVRELKAMEDIEVLEQVLLMDHDVWKHANPVCLASNYPQNVLKVMSNLMILDGFQVSEYPKVQRQVNLPKFDKLHRRHKYRLLDSVEKPEDSDMVTSQLKQAQTMQRSIRIEQMENRLRCLEAAAIYDEIQKENQHTLDGIYTVLDHKLPNRPDKNNPTTERKTQEEPVHIQQCQQHNELPEIQDYQKHTLETEARIENNQKIDAEIHEKHIAIARAEKAEHMIVTLTAELIEVKNQLQLSLQKLPEITTHSVSTNTDPEVITPTVDPMVVDTLQQQVANLRMNCTGLQKALRESRLTAQRLAGDREKLQNALKNDNLESERTIQQKIIESREALARVTTMENEVLKYKKRAKEVQYEQERARRQNLTMEEENTRKNQELSNLTLQLEQAKAFYTELSNQKEKQYKTNLQNMLNEMRGELVQLRNHCNGKLAAWKQRCEDLKSEQAKSQDIIHSCRNKESLLATQLDEANTKMNELEAENEANIAQLTIFIAKNSELEQQHVRDNENIQKLTMNQQSTSNQAEILALQKTIDEISAELLTTKSNLRAKDVMLKDQQDHIHSLKRQIMADEDEFQCEISDSQKYIRKLESSLDEQIENQSNAERLQDEYKELESELLMFEKRNRTLERRLEDANKCKDQIVAKEEALRFIENELEKMRALFAQQEEKYKTRALSNDKIHAEKIAVLDAKMKELEQDCQKMQIENTASHKELNLTLSQHEKLQSKYQESQEEINIMKGEMKILLIQIDKEKHAKQETLQQMKNIFQQFQQC